MQSVAGTIKKSNRPLESNIFKETKLKLHKINNLCRYSSLIISNTYLERNRVLTKHSLGLTNLTIITHHELITSK